MQDTTLLMLLSALGLNYFFLNWGFGGFEIKQFAEVYWGKQPQKGCMLLQERDRGF